MEATQPERALAAARAELETCGSPAFVAVAFLDGEPLLADVFVIARRRAARAGRRLLAAGGEAFVVGKDTMRDETLWTVWDAAGEHVLLIRRETHEPAIKHRFARV